MADLFGAQIRFVICLESFLIHKSVLCSRRNLIKVHVSFHSVCLNKVFGIIYLTNFRLFLYIEKNLT